MKEFYVNFIEEAIFNPKYEGYVAGRCEVFDDTSPYDIDEYRFFTNDPSFFEFRDKWDLRDITRKELGEIKRILKTKYNGL